MWWLPPLIQAGGSLLGKLFGGDEERLSPEVQSLLAKLNAMYEGGLPEGTASRISAPYYEAKRGIEQDYVRQPGVSGIKSGMIERKVNAPMSRALGEAETGWKTGLLGSIGQLSSMAKPREGKDWGGFLSGAGGVFGQAYGEEEEYKSLLGLLKKMGIFGNTGNYGFQGAG